MQLHLPDRRILLLIAVAVLSLWGGVLLDRWLLQSERSSLGHLDEVAMDSLEPEKGRADSLSGPYYAVPVQEPETFPFDPNTADSTTLLRLGLAPWQVRSIYRYRARGGRYHRPSDFKRLPGMTPELWDRLSAYVRIGERFRYYDREELAYAESTSSSPSASSLSSSSSGGSSSASPLSSGGSSSLSSSSSGGSSTFSSSADTLSRPRYPRQEKFSTLTTLDLNAVDTTTLKKVPGIGSYRARQIVRYRDRLGGYVSAEQLSEIEGLPLELQAWFVVESGVFRKINLNTASLGSMARHPYMGAGRAKAVADYRQSQGRLQSLSDLELLSLFPSDVLRRLEPYVEF